ncbi:hypothetical protein J437_LFUL015208 [Ladona fulva]|uniref:Reverse transcriptase domain-containing protein n=1 Tax=Ladona fulva TaxID=123851 RepID=A0A8K0KMX2_LADFU|nr:hypothetical protein J437_LFUL015208 [Ladona fulva]
MELRNEEGDGNERVVQDMSRVEVKAALRKMKNGKAVEADHIPVEVWKCLGEEDIDVLWNLVRKWAQQEKIPEEWRRNILVSLYKAKGDVQDCGNYRGINLISHAMNIWERIVEARIRRETKISEFAVRRLMERHKEIQMNLNVVFIDLEKTYDRVPRQEVWRCMRKKGVSVKYVKLVKGMYEGSETQVRTSGHDRGLSNRCWATLGFGT